VYKIEIEIRMYTNSLPVTVRIEMNQSISKSLVAPRPQAWPDIFFSMQLRELDFNQLRGPDQLEPVPSHTLADSNQDYTF
jgi:hypothetical protein